MEKKERKRKYLSLGFKHPNNTEDYETPLNKSLNFFLFNRAGHIRYDCSGQRGYIEVVIDIDNKTREVKKLTLRPHTTFPDTMGELQQSMESVFGSHPSQLSTTDFSEDGFLWCRLNDIVGKKTMNRYFKDYPLSYDNLNHTEFPDTLIERDVDEQGHPVIAYKPDESGYPPVMECQLWDLIELLDRHDTRTMSGTFNKIFQ